mgnify:CR=1 FL=1
MSAETTKRMAALKSVLLANEALFTRLAADASLATEAALNDVLSAITDTRAVLAKMAADPLCRRCGKPKSEHSPHPWFSCHGWDYGEAFEPA